MKHASTSPNLGQTNIMKIIAYVAGHSGGHIIPCITQAKKEFNQDIDILFFCTNNALDQKIFDKHAFIKQKILLPNISLKEKLLFLFKLKLIFLRSFIALKKYKPTKIVSMGGLVSIPVCLAAKILNIPIELWELNVEPGKATKFISKFADSINICYKQTEKYFPNKKVSLVSYPVRFDDSHKIKIDQIEQKKTIFILGGSQGSTFINNLIKDFIIQNSHLKDQIKIIHQTGKDNFDWQTFYKSNNFCAITFDFYDKIEEYYNASDLIVCRSGAGTLAEILFFQKKCLTIPLETKTTSHQILNAQAMAEEYPQLFFMLKQNDIEQNPKLFFDYVRNNLV